MIWHYKRDNDNSFKNVKNGMNDGYNNRVMDKNSNTTTNINYMEKNNSMYSVDKGISSNPIKEGIK